MLSKLALIFPLSISSLFYFFSFFLQNFLFFFFVLKICVCIYFLVGFNLWLFANTGLLGFDKKRRFGSILDIFSLHKKQRWEWVKATNREGWKTRDIISDSKAERTLEFLSPIHTLFTERAKRALPIWMERAFQLLYESKVWFMALVFLSTHTIGIYIL